jgi:hypothetical protein
MIILCAISLWNKRTVIKIAEIKYIILMNSENYKITYVYPRCVQQLNLLMGILSSADRNNMLININNTYTR